MIDVSLIRIARTVLTYSVWFKICPQGHNYSPLHRRSKELKLVHVQRLRKIGEVLGLTKPQGTTRRFVDCKGQHLGAVIADILTKRLDDTSGNQSETSSVAEEDAQITDVPHLTRSTLWKMLLGYLPCFENKYSRVTQHSDGTWPLRWGNLVRHKRAAYLGMLRAFGIQSLKLADMDKPKDTPHKKLFRQVR